MNNINKIVSFFILFTMFSCNENLSIKEEDIVKYDYLKPFLSSDKTNFKGYHNIDSEDFEFSYEVVNTKNALKEINQKANKENWVRLDLSKNNISYSRQIEIFKSELSLVVVNIKILENDKRIYFEVK